MLNDAEPEEPRRKKYPSYIPSSHRQTYNVAGNQGKFDPKLYSVEKHSTSYPLDKQTSWFFIPAFDIPEDGPLRLGQVLPKPQAFVEGLLPIDRVAEVESTQIHMISDVDFQFTPASAAASASIRSQKQEEHLRLHAQRIETSSFYPDQAYVQKVLESLQSIGEADILKGSQLRSGKCYIVRGIRVAEGLEIWREKTKVVNPSLGARLTTLGVPVEASLGGLAKSSTEDHYAATQRVIIAYSLVEVKRTDLGNIYSSTYTKGSMF